MNITKEIAVYVAETEFADIPQDTLRMGKLCFLDWLGVTIAGAKSDVSSVAQKYLSLFSSTGPATLIGLNKKCHLPSASLVNGMLTHALDFDDYHMSTILHTTAPSLPAILATAEYMKSNGKDLLTAITLAIDIELRLGMGVGRVHYERGWHITSTIGRFGAVAGVSRLLNLKPDTIVNALGIAATSGGGLRNVFGTMSKPFHVGKAAMDGLMACFLAQQGLDSSKDIFDGKHGFFELFTENPDHNAIIKELGGRFFLTEMCFKTYPAPLCVHSTIDLMIEIQKECHPLIEDVKAIEIDVDNLPLDAAGIVEPKTLHGGRFSIYFLAALALAEGKVTTDNLTEEKVLDPGLETLRKKVKARGLSNVGLSAHINVHMKDGTTYEKYTPAPKGSSENPLSDEELKEKFKTTSGLSPTIAEEVIEKVMRLEKLRSINEILSLI